MADRQTILVTGAAGYWGSRLVARLVASAEYRVMGLDALHPAADIPGLDFVRADVRNPLLADLLRAEGVEVVCHLAFRDTKRPREPAFDLNVMGATKVLGACGEAGVRKVIVKSSMAVYGALVTNPAFLTEDHDLRGSRRLGYVHDMVEIEVLCSGFRRKQPQLILTILRFPGIVGPAADTRMTRFLRDPWAPSLLGFDPMMQVIHEDDVVESLFHAVQHDLPGVFNVAAEGVLPLSRVRRLAGKPPLAVFHKLPYWGANLLGFARLGLGRFSPIPPDYLRYPWVGDLNRMREEFGFAPRHSAEETLRQFADRSRPQGGPASPSRDARAEEHLRRILEQRRRIRRRHPPTSPGVEEVPGRE